SPANRLAAFFHGLAVGIMIMLVRAYGIWPDAVPFAVLLVNLLSPHLDRIRPRVRHVTASNGALR
ncbi:MAG: RnfABCDGE type electron transport complex subunit D, partial [Acidobacteriota bacterium]